MRPISRLLPRASAPLPSSCCRNMSSSARTIWPVTATSTPPCRHKSKAHPRQPPPPLGRATSEPTAPLRVFKPSTRTPTPSDSPVFTQSSVPPLSFWQSQLPQLGPADMTASQCLDAARLYCDGSPVRDLAWSKKLLADNPGVISPYILHYLAIMLLYAIPNAAPTKELGWNMLVTAHEMDYAPASLQLTIEFDREFPPATRPRTFQSPAQVRSAIARHQALVRAGRDPSALALQAQHFAAQGDKARSTEFFCRAYQAGVALPPRSSPSGSGSTETVPRRPRWLLEATSRMVYGTRALKQGKMEEAEAAVRPAALGLDNGDAYAALAKICADAEERKEFALKGAMMAVPSACEEMAEIEGQRATEEGLEEGERRMRMLMSKEWELLGRFGGAGASGGGVYDSV